MENWKNIYFTTSITQIIGAGSAGLFYKILSSNSFINFALAITIYAILYLSYRQIIKNTNESITKAEKAEKERIEAEKKRAEEAEANLAKLSILFDEQEKISHDLKQSKEALEKTAYYDSLTQIPNRTYLIERLELLIELRIDIVHKYYVLFIDLNRFKNINDSFGHPVGDKVLFLVAKRLKTILREEDTIARLGGDEFAVILNDLSSVSEAENFARRIHKKLSQPFSVDGHKIYTSLHIGVSPLEADHLKPEDVLRDADIAMHHAKVQRLPVGVFNKSLRNHFLETIKLETDLRFAVKRNELVLHYQPIISLETGELTGIRSTRSLDASEIRFYIARAIYSDCRRFRFDHSDDALDFARSLFADRRMAKDFFRLCGFENQRKYLRQTSGGRRPSRTGQTRRQFRENQSLDADAGNYGKLGDGKSRTHDCDFR